MNVRAAMIYAGLTLQQRAAVYDHLLLTPEEVNKAIEEGYLALNEARRALYGEEF